MVCSLGSNTAHSSLRRIDSSRNSAVLRTFTYFHSSLPNPAVVRAPHTTVPRPVRLRMQFTLRALTRAARTESHRQVEGQVVNTVTELQIHGVGGATAGQLLDESKPVQVAGDGVAGFFRARTKVAPHDREAYVWGGLTSSAIITGLWWLLLPFTLANVSGWVAGRRKHTTIVCVLVDTVRRSGPKLPETGSHSDCPQVNRLSAMPWLFLRRESPGRPRSRVGMRWLIPRAHSASDTNNTLRLPTGPSAPVNPQAELIRPLLPIHTSEPGSLGTSRPVSLIALSTPPGVIKPDQPMSVADAVSIRGPNMGRGLGLVGTGLDSGVDCSHLRKRSGSQLPGEGSMGAGPGVMNGTSLFPVTGTIA